ncbi:helix-turn-helix domain-containing protein [Rathayibacter sp. VKM Ac-2857]|uniref:helix-turn-helix domain-containing protein n=1 Tax=Rathayibacter sp. VKM Ac-2857 TaxID=2739020 RepID=UPI001567BA48|nr:XRE family transcriptional regulator [Rathayibacter sp. VKM Ac-2857]NQX16128.1 helix-turn-helix domain-containing protein [Rathayibacter sp. VKM Ac-2857]
MTEMSSRVLGTRIRETRSRRGMSQDELGAAVGLERSVVSKIEAGVRRVTALELSDIAAALGARMSEFFEDPTPAIIAHRSSRGLDTVDSNIDGLLSGLVRDVEFIAGLNAAKLPRAVDDSGARPRWKPPTTGREAEALAVRARELLALPEDAPARDLSELVSKAGLLAFSSDIGADTADAGSVQYTLGGIAVVNSHMKVGRRRLALAHELGHHLTAAAYVVDWRVSEHGLDSVPLESKLDRFARAVLLPEQALLREWPTLVETSGARNAAILTASRYRVDFASLASRLRELDLVSQDDAAVVRQCKPIAADYIELDLHAPPEELTGTSVPRQFSKAVLDLVKTERISRERGLDLLRRTLADEDLPEVRPRRADEIWSFVS